MAPMGPWILYNDFKLNVFKKLLAMHSDNFAVALVTSASNAIDATLSPATYAGITNELETAGGYTAGGYAVGAGVLTGGGANPVITFDTANTTWTGAGGGFVARAAVLYDVTTGYLVAYSLLDSAPADVTVAAGNTLIVQITDVFTDT